MYYLDFDYRDPRAINFCFMTLVISVGIFHIYMERRQYKYCALGKEPPNELKGVISPISFEKTRLDEMHRSELEIWKHCVYTICSIGELMFGLYPLLWNWATNVGISLGDLNGSSVTSVVFLFLFSSYIALRYFLIVLFDRIVLQPLYGDDESESAPVIGLVCATAFVIVFVQIFLTPFALMVILMEQIFGQYFFILFWFYFFIISIVLTIVLTWISIPFFCKQKPLSEGPLRTQLETLMKISGFSLKSVHIIYSYHWHSGSAFFYGFCCLKRLVVFDNLLLNQGKAASEIDPEDVGKGLTDSQVVAFVAHALGHWRYMHFYVVFVVIHLYLLIWFLLFGVCYYYPTIFEAVGFKSGLMPDIVSYILIYKFILPPYMIMGNFLVLWLLRSNDFRSDIYVAKLGYSFELRGGLLKHYQDNEYYPLVDRLYWYFYRRAPILLNRLRRLDSWDNATQFK